MTDLIARIESADGPDRRIVNRLDRGWRVFEGKGWICPHHKKQAPTKSGGSDAE